VPLDNRDLNYGKYTNSGEEAVSEVDDYTSHNTHRLNRAELKEMILKLDYVQKSLTGLDAEAY
jgi:UDP-glucose 4-epimerase